MTARRQIGATVLALALGAGAFAGYKPNVRPECPDNWVTVRKNDAGPVVTVCRDGVALPMLTKEQWADEQKPELIWLALYLHVTGIIIGVAVAAPRRRKV